MLSPLAEIRRSLLANVNKGDQNEVITGEEMDSTLQVERGQR